MNKFYYLLAVVVCGVMFSCQNDESLLDDSQMKYDMVAKATLEDDAESRTQFSEVDKGYKVLWSENDEISIFTSNTAHAKFALSNGVGETTADFIWKEGSFSFSTGDATDNFACVGVYPYWANTTVSKVGNDYEILTQIPASQTYAENSHGQNAAPMVAVDPAMQFAFKNVASYLVMPLKGEATIKFAKLESKAHKIAGEVKVVAEAAKEWIPTVEVTENGVNKIEMAFEQGVELSETEATKFIFVLAPGTYEANDLVVTFYDSYGNYFETEITAENTFTRSKSRTFSARTFEVAGTEKLDLYIRAEAAAYMEAERIIPSLNDINIKAWAKNLKDKENTRALIEEAISFITLKNYKAAYEVLGGIPGFVKETKMFEAKGSFIQKVDYTGVSYLTSMLEQIEDIHDIPSLLQYMQEFENIYEGSGVKNKLNEALGNFGDNIDQIIDYYVDQMVNKPTVDSSNALDAYKAEIKKQLKSTLDGAKFAVAAIKVAQLIDASAFSDEKTSFENYINKAQPLYDGLDNLDTLEDIQAAVEELPVVEIKISRLNIDESFKPIEWLSDAKNAYDEALKNLVTENETAINLAKAALKTAIGKLQGVSIVESLEKVVNDPESATSKFLTTLFANEEFMNTVKSTLRTVVAEIEEASKNDITNGNIALKEAAILTAKTNAITNARIDAGNKIKDEFTLTNQTNLSNLNAGPWGIFQKVLNSNTAIKVFEELDILQVYDALIKLSKIVEGMITYDKGTIYYPIEEIEDYQENIDWWVIEGAPVE